MTVMLTDLADACRASGLKVVEVPGWRTRSAAPNGSRYGGPGLDAAPRGIICHHTATPGRAAGDYPTYGTILAGNSQTDGPLAQIGLGRSGVVYVFAAGICWHAGPVHDPRWQSNRYAVGIEAEHPGDATPWPRAQYDAYVRLVAALADHYGIPTDQVAGHREVSTVGKIDPTFNLDVFRAAVDAARADAAMTDPDTGVPVLEPGDTGPNVKLWQIFLMKMFPRTHGKLVAEHGGADGSYGDWTAAATRSFQLAARADGRYHSTVDGIRGPATYAAAVAYGYRGER